MSPSATRRGFLRTVAGAGTAFGLGGVLTACGSGSGSANSAKVLKWWENSPTKSTLNKKIFKRHAKDLPGTVKITNFANTKMGQALQLAKQSGQLPDVHTTAGLKTQPAMLIDAGWFQPLDLPKEALAQIDDDLILDGVHRFNGKLYTFPLFTPKHYTSLLWFNPNTISKAGLDPSSPPATYDDFRAACRTVTKKTGGRVAGLVLPLKDTVRLSQHVGFWVNGAGFAGYGRDGQLFTTGEFAFHSDPYLTVIEFFKSLIRDKLVLSASSTLDGSTARGRWASGGAAYELDGPWVPGTLKVEFPSVADKIGYGPMAVPDRSHDPICYTGPAIGVYYLSKHSKKLELANDALGLVASREWQVDFGSIMDQPPRDPKALEESNATPLYKAMAKMLQQSCFTRPLPVSANADVAKVDAELHEVKPGLGDVVQGYLTGQITDLRGSLKKLSDASNKALDAAIAKAKSKRGSHATRDDYAFPNWKPRADFTKSMYKQA